MSNDDILNNLTYSMKEKTNKLSGLKQQIDTFQQINNKIKTSIVYVAISIISLILLLFQYNLTINYILRVFIFFIVLIYNITVIKNNLIKISSRYEKLKSDYSNLRLDIITTLDNRYVLEFCVHNNPCKCKEKYIKLMKNKYNIDLIFK